MKLKAIARRSAEQMVADALRAQITTGDLLPGSRLTETNLSEMLKVSRGTLRIALHQLSKEGLVVQTPYTGWSVTTIAPEDLWELYTLRADLESMATRLICADLDDTQRHAIERSYKGLLDACEVGVYSKIAERDFLLHQTIIALAGHRRLAEHYRLVEQQIRVFVATTYHFVPAPGSVIEHHAPIVEAMLRGETSEACRLIEDHATSEGKKLYEFLIRQQSDFPNFRGVPQ